MCNNKFLLVTVDQVYNFDITFQLMAQQRDRLCVSVQRVVSKMEWRPSKMEWCRRRIES